MTQSNYVYSSLDRECWADTVREIEREKDSDTYKRVCMCVHHVMCICRWGDSVNSQIKAIIQILTGFHLTELADMNK